MKANLCMSTVSGVSSGLYLENWITAWFPSVCLGWPYAVFAKIAQCTRKRMLRAVPPVMRVQYIVCCWTYAPEQFPETSITLLDKSLVQSLQVKYVQGLRFFICGCGKFSEGVDILQQKKFRGSVFIKKFVPRGTNLRQVHFFWHICLPEHTSEQVKCQNSLGACPQPPNL